MKMGRKRRTFTDKFKTTVAIEAIRGIKTLNELALEYQVHPNQISRYFEYYNSERNHSALDKRTPAEVFMERAVSI